MHCDRCGDFEISRTASVNFERYRRDELKVALFSGWVREQNMQGATPDITSDDLDRILELSFPGFNDRVSRYLSWAAKKQVSLAGDFESFHPSTISITYSASENDVGRIYHYLKDQGLLEERTLINVAKARVTIPGLIEADRLAAKNAISKNAFVAMWFDNLLRPIYDQGFAVGIRRAGFVPMRVDNVEHAGKIDDEIIGQIRMSRFVVADFTGHRGGVYFEAGFAFGLGKPVIWTCRSDHLPDLHFDIRQYNCIEWQRPDELADKLANRILAVIG